jgi:hypothetical protein
MGSVSTSASVWIPRERGEVFRVATDMTNTPRTVRKWGPFAGIRKIEMLEGVDLAVGARRRIYMTDGSEFDETIYEYDPPARHRYGWSGGVKPPFAWLVNSGGGMWEFIEAEGGTRVVWRYTFGLTSPLAYPLALPVAWLFRAFLQQGLDALRDEMLGVGG